MANWIWNKLSDNVKTLDIFTDGLIDFEKIIPSPKSKDDCPEEFRLDIHPNSMVTPTEERPWFNWYNWRNEHWGVSANADTHPHAKDTQLEFDTKWTPPTKILEKLSAMIPDTEITLLWEDMDNVMSPTHKDIYKNGKIIKRFQADYDPETDTLGNWIEIQN